MTATKTLNKLTESTLPITITIEMLETVTGDLGINWTLSNNDNCVFTAENDISDSIIENNNYNIKTRNKLSI